MVRTKPARPAATILSTEDETALVDAMRMTWSMIGADVLHANNDRPMPRSHVIEVVLDCGHLEDTIKSRRVDKVQRDRLLAFVESTYRDHARSEYLTRDLAKRAFPFGRYGL